MIIESGVGTGNRLAVFDDRIAADEVGQSLASHISTSELNGRTGVFSLINNSSGTFGIQGTSILNITNGDPNNFLIIDKMSVQIASSSLTLPDPRYEADLVVINSATFSSQVFPIIDNRSLNNLPLVFSSVAGTGTTKTIFKIYPTLGDSIDMVPQNSDGIILAYGNGLRVSIGGFGGTFTIEGFIRFMMVPPDQLG